MDKVIVKFQDAECMGNARYEFTTDDGYTWMSAVEDYIDFLDKYCGFIIDEGVKKKVIKSIHKHQNKHAKGMLGL